MKTIILKRSDFDLRGTRGKLFFNGCPLVFTLELPWRNNKTQISCIPEGMYLCKIAVSDKLGKAYELQNVPDRSGIFIHSGNFAGAVDIGLKSDVEGCILVGNSFINNDDQFELLESLKARQFFMSFMKGEDFYINIINNDSK